MRMALLIVPELQSDGMAGSMKVLVQYFGFYKAVCAGAQLCLVQDNGCGIICAIGAERKG